MGGFNEVSDEGSIGVVVSDTVESPLYFTGQDLKQALRRQYSKEAPSKLAVKATKPHSGTHPPTTKICTHEAKHCLPWDQ